MIYYIVSFDNDREGLGTERESIKVVCNLFYSVFSIFFTWFSIFIKIVIHVTAIGSQ